MNDAQQALIATMKAEYATADIIFKCINVLPGLLHKYGIVKGINEEEMVVKD